MVVSRKKRVLQPPTGGASTSLPLVSGEYLNMVRDYERAEKKRKVEPAPAPRDPSPNTLKSKQPKQSKQSNKPKIAKQATPTPEVSNDESEMDSDEFENVALDEGDMDNDNYNENEGVNSINDISISFTEPKRQALTKNGRAKSDPKEHRLAVHKLCLIAWFVHCHTRDEWLRSPLIVRNKQLKTLLPVSITSKLFPPSHLTPFLKSKTFIDGLRAAMEFWQTKFTILNPGLASTDETKAGDPSNYADYTSRLLRLAGSTDMLGQGFVGLLRALNFRVRLVCSMQPPDNLNANENSVKKKQSPESKCPLFWAEVRDEFVNGWVSVDPLTSTIRLPTKNCVKVAIEPPLNDVHNILRYAIAFEERGCRDVTKRYASAYNARTRKKRLPYVDGDVFLNRLYALYAPKQYTQEDVLEIKELDKYPRLEGIPTRAQDFINHPIYALSDGLHTNEILSPEAKPCGTLALKNKQTTFIYKRQDVLTVRSEQSWYRRGRKVKIGVVARKVKNTKNRLSGETDKVKLYTFNQTDLYKPPPVSEDGQVPKSEYHSIDIFTKSMIPEGAVYIPDKLGKKAARILFVDYANAVVGVDFSRQGARSRVQGVVVAKQYEQAVLEVIKGLKEEEIANAEEADERRIMELWRKLIVGIQIWDRIETMNPDKDAVASDNSDNSDNSDDSDDFNSDDLGSDDEYSDNSVPKKHDTLKAPSQAPLKGSQAPQASLQPDDDSDNEGGFASPTSPTSHSSFSDLDIDDVSESDLK